MTEREEKKNKSIALATTLGVHALLFLAFLLIMAWRAPNPPLPEYGIELNFGLEDQGSGAVQPEEPVSSEQAATEQAQEEEVAPESAEEPTKEDAKSEEPVSEQESPVVVKEEKKEILKPKKETTTEKTTEKLPEKKETTQQQTKTTSEAEKKSQGDDVNKPGDKGSEEGKIDAKALYGTQGGAGGTGFDLSMSGWAWASTPQIPKLPDNEDGRIVFEIECDDNGEIIGINTLERGLSARAEQLLKEEIRNNSLIRTSGGKVPERSKGKVVFLLKSK